MNNVTNKYQDQVPATLDKERAIPTALNELDDALTAMDDIVERIQARLEPVTKNYGDKADCEKDAGRPIMACAMTERLAGFTERLRNAYGRLATTVSKLEL